MVVQNPICWCWPSRTRSTKLGMFTWPLVPTSIHHNLLRPTWIAILWNDTPSQWNHPMPPLPNNSNWTKRTRVCLRRISPFCSGFFHRTDRNMIHCLKLKYRWCTVTTLQDGWWLWVVYQNIYCTLECTHCNHIIIVIVLWVVAFLFPVNVYWDFMYNNLSSIWD